MDPRSSPAKLWPLPVAVIACIAIFGGTFFAYAERERLHKNGSYLPLLIGISAFMLAMYVACRAAFPARAGKAWRVWGTVFGLTVFFFYALMFLLLNIYGS